MCDKLQTSKDGSVDLCHGRLVEYSSPHRSVYSNNSISGSSNNGSNGNRKQRKYNGKDNYGTDSGLSPKSRNKERSCGSRRDRDGQVGSVQSQRWPKHGRQDSRKNKESSSGEVFGGGRHRREDGGGSEVGKKKAPPTSLNHLLNFTVASAERHYSGRGVMPPIARHRKRNTSHSYNKEEFLQANCQFVVSASGDYNIHSEDPDKLVEWEYIQQVRLFCHEIPSCPICLYPPRAAKITRCGHVYCWSCLLHYLSLGEKKWSKCPICNESIYRQDVKSVAALSSPQYKVGDKISMKLMVRGKGSTQVFASADWDGKDHAMLTVEDSCVNQFVKLVSATPSQVLSVIISPERTALQAQLAQLDAGEASEKCFIEAALKDLEMRESELVKAQAVHTEMEQIISESSSVSLTTPQPMLSPATSSSWTAFSDQYFEGGYEHPFLDICGERDSTYSSQSQEEDGGAGEKNEVEGIASPTQPLSCTMEMGENEERESSMESSPNSLGSPRSFTSDGSNNGDPLPSQIHRGHLIYFYQASDGQHFYMHPVNIKCLAKEYGGLEYCPCEVTATVVEIEQLTMSEELRGRYKSLSHLPLTCELALCELDLKPPTVSLDTLEHFSVEIHKRKQKRVKKKKDERRREKRAEAKTTYSEPTYRVPSALELTPEKFHDFLSLTSSPSLSDAAATKTDPLEIEGGSSSVGTPPPPSFAQALRCKSSIWPMKMSPKGVAGRQNSDADMPIPEEETAVPSFQDAFNEAFQTASMSINKATEGKPGSKTAKKGRKKLVLFSTGGSRGYN